MGDRITGNWLKAYAGPYTAEMESPDSFHIWTGLSVLASALRRNVWFNQGHYLLYPNMFVILVGPPGKVAKSTTIRAGRRILLGVEDIFFGPDSVTREEMIEILAKISDKDVTKSAALTTHSSELSSLIEPSGIKMIQFLTDIYDCDDTFKYSTKHQGKSTIRRPVVNILAGTTPSWISEGLPADVVGHGFTSRVIFVYEEEPRFLNPHPKEPPKEAIAALVDDLRHIATLKGEFRYGEGAEDMYAKLYRKIYAKRPKDYRIEGFHWRKKGHLLKVAMLLAVAERDDLVVETVDLETAWELLNQLEIKMYKTFSAVGKYEHASDLERILQNIEEVGEMSVKDIYDENYAVGSTDDIARILLMLQRMGRVKAEQRKGVTYYVATRKV